jgi:hypothetical protein
LPLPRLLVAPGNPGEPCFVLLSLQSLLLSSHGLPWCLLLHQSWDLKPTLILYNLILI